MEIGPASSCEASTATEAPSLPAEVSSQDAAESRPEAGAGQLTGSTGLASSPDAATDLASLPDAAIAEAFVAGPEDGGTDAAARGGAGEGGSLQHIMRLALTCAGTDLSLLLRLLLPHRCWRTLCTARTSSARQFPPRSSAGALHTSAPPTSCQCPTLSFSSSCQSRGRP